MIDLHTHTTASDGTDHPQELVHRAVSAGVQLLAITDHDTFDGWEAARSTASNAGIRLVPGVELSTSLDEDKREAFGSDGRDIHLLAYFPSGEPNGAFRAWVRTLEASRWERNRRLLERLLDRGIAIPEEELRARGGSVAGRVHLARILRERNLVGTIDEAFDRFLGEDADTYVPRRSPAISSVVRRIRESGGVASLAHPVRVWGDDREAGEGIVRWLASQGLQAIEAWHSEQSPAYSTWLCALARDAGLRVTGGSDFHGANKPRIALGTGHGREPLVPAGDFDACWRDAEDWGLFACDRRPGAPGTAGHREANACP